MSRAAGAKGGSDLPKGTFLNLPDDKRQRIIDEALEEFAEQPYHQASLSRIVRRAGIAKGSMYQYFEDKFDLYMYLLSLTGQLKLQYVQHAMERAAQDAGLFELLSAAAEGGLRLAQDHPKLQRLGDRLLTESDEFLQEVMGRIGDVSNVTMDSWVADAQARGTVDRRIRPTIAAYVIQTLTIGMGRDMAAGRIARDDVLTMMREVFHVLEYGMRPRTEGAGRRAERREEEREQK